LPELAHIHVARPTPIATHEPTGGPVTKSLQFEGVISREIPGVWSVARNEANHTPQRSLNTLTDLSCQLPAGLAVLTINN
jgi:hypothetical protein